MSPSELSEALRLGTDSFLWYRQAMILLYLIACLCMLFILVYQRGLVSRLPEPFLPRLSGNLADAEPETTNRSSLPMPPAGLGILSYAGTICLISFGGANRAETWSWIPLLMMGKILLDASQAGLLLWEQWSEREAVCCWCLVVAFVTIPAVLLAIPECASAAGHFLDAPSWR